MICEMLTHGRAASFVLLPAVHRLARDLFGGQSELAEAGCNRGGMLELPFDHEYISGSVGFEGFGAQHLARPAETLPDGVEFPVCDGPKQVRHERPGAQATECASFMELNRLQGGRLNVSRPPAAAAGREPMPLKMDCNSSAHLADDRQKDPFQEIPWGPARVMSAADERQRRTGGCAQQSREHRLEYERSATRAANVKRNTRRL